MTKVYNKFAHMTNFINSNFILTSCATLLILQTGKQCITFVNSSTISPILDTDARAVTITSKLENYHSSPNITTTTTDKPTNGYLNVYSGNDSYGKFPIAFTEKALQTSDTKSDTKEIHVTLFVLFFFVRNKNFIGYNIYLRELNVCFKNTNFLLMEFTTFMWISI